MSGALGKCPLVMSNPDRQGKKDQLHFTAFASTVAQRIHSSYTCIKTSDRNETVNKPLNVYLTENLDGQSWHWLRKIHLLTSSHLQIMVKSSSLRSKHGQNCNILKVSTVKNSD